MNTSPSVFPRERSKGMNIALWIAQSILAAMFLIAGIMKSSMPLDKLGAQLPWVNEVPAYLVRFIGASELIGSIGLILPSLTRIKPILTPIAAIGLTLIMLLATIFHITHHEMPAIGFTLVLAGIAIFIAWGRLKKSPVQSRLY